MLKRKVFAKIVSIFGNYCYLSKKRIVSCKALTDTLISFETEGKVDLTTKDAFITGIMTARELEVKGLFVGSYYFLNEFEFRRTGVFSFFNDGNAFETTVKQTTKTKRYFLELPKNFNFNKPLFVYEELYDTQETSGNINGFKEIITTPDGFVISLNRKSFFEFYSKQSEVFFNKHNFAMVFLKNAFVHSNFTIFFSVNEESGLDYFKRLNSEGKEYLVGVSIIFTGSQQKVLGVSNNSSISNNQLTAKIPIEEEVYFTLLLMVKKRTNVRCVNDFSAIKIIEALADELDDKFTNSMFLDNERAFIYPPIPISKGEFFVAENMFYMPYDYKIIEYKHTSAEDEFQDQNKVNDFLISIN